LTVLSALAGQQSGLEKSSAAVCHGLTSPGTGSPHGSRSHVRVRCLRPGGR
jgi:hypothetical protein